MVKKKNAEIFVLQSILHEMVHIAIESEYARKRPIDWYYGRTPRSCRRGTRNRARFVRELRGLMRHGAYDLLL